MALRFGNRASSPWQTIARTNSAEKKMATWIETGNPDSSPRATSTATSDTAACKRYSGRTYHRSPSKQKMKLTRYNASGTTHRKGTVATSRQT